MKKLPNPFARFQTSFEKFKKSNKIHPFSWQTAFALSLLSWVVCLLVRGETARQFVALYGWFFLFLGVYWFFLDDKYDDKKLKIPTMRLLINYGPWIAGAIVCAAFLSYRFLLTTFSAALVAWPLVSVALTALPKILTRREVTRASRVEERLSLALPQDAGVRQDLIILLLVGVLFSCWFQFNFFLQSLLREYPSLLNDDFSQSAFVVRLDAPNPDSSIGASILTVAEAEIRESLSGQSWLDTQRWLRNIDTRLPQLEDTILDQAFQEMPANFRERLFWEFDADFADALPDDVLQLQAVWTGPSSATNGYSLQKTCLIRPTSLELFSRENTTEGIGPSYEMNCGAIRSSLQPQDSPAGREE